MRHQLLTFAAFGALVAGAACAEPSAAPAGEEPSATAAPAQPAAASARSALAAAQGKLAAALIETLAKPGSASTIVSPASLAAVFALVGEGADAPMKIAIATALGFSAGDPAPAFAALKQARQALATDAGGQFQFADRLVLAPGSEPRPELVARLAALGVTPEVLDLSKPEAVAAIDGWVSKTTKGAIPELLGAPLDAPAFVALDALRFKGKWKTPFDPQLTAPAPFNGLDGVSADVAMMRLTAAPRAFRTDARFIGVDLPFAGERFSLVVVTTRETPASAHEFATIGDWLTGAGFATRKGDLMLPRFSLDARAELLPALDALGLAAARRSSTALAAFGEGTMLAQVVLRAMIEVDEEGAEAAAATAVMATRALEADDSLHMIVDKPFVFALRDRESGAILVAGYVGQAPVAAKAK